MQVAAGAGAGGTVARLIEQSFDFSPLSAQQRGVGRQPIDLHFMPLKSDGNAAHNARQPLYQPAVIGTHFTGIILAQGKARFAP